MIIGYRMSVMLLGLVALAMACSADAEASRSSYTASIGTTTPSAQGEDVATDPG